MCKYQTTCKKAMELPGCGSKEFVKSLPLSHFLPIPLLFSALFLGTSAIAQDKTNEIDKIFSWVNQNEPGCICAVSQDGKVIVNRAYGRAHMEREVPLSSNSILDAGSVVKQSVAASVLLLVEDGKLSLTEDIHK